MVGNVRRKKEVAMLVEKEEEDDEKEEEEKEEKKEVGFDVKAGRILESSQNEVRPHEPYINQPRLLSSSFSLVPPAPIPCFLQDGPLYLRPRSPPLIRSPACPTFSRGRRLPPSWTARHGIKQRSHKTLLISYFFLRHVPSSRWCCSRVPTP